MSELFPFTSLISAHRELGLVVALAIGFAFGFVLERAGFGRSTKLAAQFYLTDMTVFKVMFGAIVTAMVGVLVADGVGLVDLRAISETAVSFTYLWPMLVGGLLLGVGFIVSGYCPGTSIVAAASGNFDGLATFAGVIIGSVFFGEIYALFPQVAQFHVSSDLGHLFLYDWLGIPAPVLAAVVTAVAVAAFFGAEKVEALMAKRNGNGAEAAQEAAKGHRPRRLVFSALGVTALLALATLAMPVKPEAAAPAKDTATVSQEAFARTLLDRPWTLRVLDLRSDKSCRKQRIPGAECTPTKVLPKLGLQYADGHRDLVLVDNTTATLAEPAAKYPGRVLLLEGGFDGWRKYALTKPPLPDANATAAVKERYEFRAALHSAMTGIKPAPPPPASKSFAPKPRKKKGGGCG